MAMKKTTWAPPQDEALLRTMKKNHTTAEAFVADYRAESGDVVHGVGAIAFRAIQAASFLREGLDRKLRTALQNAGRAEQGIHRTPPSAPLLVATTPAVVATTASKAPSEAPVTPAAKAKTPSASGEVTIDGEAYLDIPATLQALKVSRSTLRQTHERRLVVRVQNARPFYQKASVLALAAEIHAPKVKVVKVPEKAPDALVIDGVPCLSTSATAAKFGMDPRPFGNQIGRRMTGRWSAAVRSRYYAEAEVDAMLATVSQERKAAEAAAAKAVETKKAPAPSNLVPITSAPAAKVPVKTMSEMTLSERLDAVNRALASGVLTPEEHRSKVRMLAASA